MNQQLSSETTYIDKITNKASTTWLKWEKYEKGWQKKVTSYGNKLFERIPYQEWGLKSVPPLSERGRAEELEGKEKVLVQYPGRLYDQKSALDVLRVYGGKERQAIHTKWMWGSIIGMPITAPVALLPM